MAARIAPLRGITEQSMRQATRRAERHVAQLLTLSFHWGLGPGGVPYVEKCS
jgi:hypothetical protein